VSRGTVIDFCYLIAAITFILALKGLSSPKHARRGTLVGAAGMALAIGPPSSGPALAHLADRHRDGHRRGHRRAGWRGS